ncbi:MAG: endonuclease MutS2 [Chitinophagales bacterium]
MNTFPKDTNEKLEFDKIKAILLKNCLSDLGQQQIEEQNFQTDIFVLQKQLRQVFEMKSALENAIHFPAQNYLNLEGELKYLGIENYTLEGKQFRKILNFLLTIEAIFKFFEKYPDEYKTLAEIIEPIYFERTIPTEIEKVIDEEGGIRSDASAELVSIRRKINGKNQELNKVFNKLIGNLKKQGILADSEESIRNNRRVLAVQASNKRSIGGIILDESESGKTSYIEPQETVFLNNEIFELEREEKREILKILKELTAKIAVSKDILQDYSFVLAKFDAIRAKALLALSLDANMPILSREPVIELKEAYHPILFLHNKALQKETYPLDIKITKSKHIILISGPNAGGKSISLKTLGLIQMMLQFGLLVPCDENSKIRLFKNIFTDLGDNQSIEDELSTYSSRLNRMKYFIENSNPNTLYLIDEFGTGTDPRFGAAMAEAILNKLIASKAFGIVTTHYSNLKKIGEAHQNIENGAMLFDEDNFKPQYKLKLGKPGSSYTFAIAEKIGLKPELIAEAKSLVDYSDLKFDELLEQVEKERKHFETQSDIIKQENAKLKKLMSKFDKMNDDLEHQKNRLLQKQVALEQEKSQQADKQARTFLNKLNKAKSKENLAVEIQNRAKTRKEVLGKKEVEFAKKTEQANTENLKVGDFVYLKNNDREGKIIEIRKNKAVVNFNGLSTTVNVKDLLKAIQEKRPEIKKSKRVVTINDVEKTFDVRGLMQDSARVQIEGYFDQALLNNIETIKIIHGKGTGALRNLVKSLVREYKTNILEWKFEEEKRGGDGATIITFK